MMGCLSEIPARIYRDEYLVGMRAFPNRLAHVTPSASNHHYNRPRHHQGCGWTSILGGAEPFQSFRLICLDGLIPPRLQDVWQLEKSWSGQ